MRQSLVLLIALIALMVSSAPGLAQDATPAPDVGGPTLASSGEADRTDLAAVALTPADLPPGFVNVDERYFLSAQGVSTFFTSEASSPEEIATVGLVSLYDSFYEGGPDGFLYHSIAEFTSAEEVQAGFDIFEDESRVPQGVEVLWTQDFPAPEIGEAPSEITVASIDYRSNGGPLVTSTALTFRVDVFLIAIALEMPLEEVPTATQATPATSAAAASATPVLDPEADQFLREAAATVVERLNAVQADESASGTDASLPPLLLPTDQTWPLPGVAAEGYKDAALVLGSLGPAAAYAGEFESAYARTVAPGTGPDDLFPQPPFVTLGVSVFRSPDAAMSVLEEAGTLPVPGPLPSPPLWEPVETTATPQADAMRTYRSTFEPGGPVDSARVAFVSGPYLVTVDVQLAASEEAALAIAEDLAAQQAACLAAEGACPAVMVPEALAADGEGTPVAQITMGWARPCGPHPFEIGIQGFVS
jgi:hypothetical protein